MPKKLRDTDQSLWNAYVQSVAPLGTPERSLPQSSLPDISQARGNRLDLHGLTLQEAYAATRAYLEKAASDHKIVTVITGLGGRIAQEFPTWMENCAVVSRIESMNGGGAYLIFFHRKK